MLSQPKDTGMPIKQQIFSLVVCILIFVFIIDMVRKKKLREEYSALWLITSLLMFILVIKYDWLVLLTRSIGAGLPTTTLFMCSILFLMLIALQFSFRISKHADQIKNLVQENALLSEEVSQLKKQQKPTSDGL